MRTSATQIEMEWEPLSPMESRGFLKGYKVTYAPSILGCTVTDQVVSVFTVENKLVLNGLSPTEGILCGLCQHLLLKGVA